MGACKFSTRGYDKTAKEAYFNAIEDVIGAYGDDPYNGSISTTDGFKLLICPHTPGTPEFNKWIDSMYDAAKKYGPALAVQRGKDEFLFFGWAAE